MIMSCWIAVADWGHKQHPDGVQHRQFLFWHKVPRPEHGRTMLFFDTRAQCRAWIKEAYGYLARPENADLRKAPHWWRMPRPIKIKLQVKEL